VAYSGGHRTLRDAVETQLAGAGWETNEIEDLLAETTKLEPFYVEGLCPPPLTKSGGRNLMKRLCDDGDVNIEGEYLKPHGGRRALGSELYDTDAELAQETLRHESIETTNKSYRDKQAEERARKIDDVLSDK
jgi:integrase